MLKGFVRVRGVIPLAVTKEDQFNDWRDKQLSTIKQKFSLTAQPIVILDRDGKIQDLFNSDGDLGISNPFARLAAYHSTEVAGNVGITPPAGSTYQLDSVIVTSAAGGNYWLEENAGGDPLTQMVTLGVGVYVDLMNGQNPIIFDGGQAIDLVNGLVGDAWQIIGRILY